MKLNGQALLRIDFSPSCRACRGSQKLTPGLIDKLIELTSGRIATDECRGFYSHCYQEHVAKWVAFLERNRPVRYLGRLQISITRQKNTILRKEGKSDSHNPYISIPEVVYLLFHQCHVKIRCLLNNCPCVSGKLICVPTAEAYTNEQNL